MLYFATISRCTDGLALAANSDSPPVSDHAGLDDAHRKMKMLSRLSSRFPDRCSLPGPLFTIHFITALDLSYFVLCDTTYPQVLAFSFLSDMQKDFLQYYDQKKIMSVQRPYALIDFDYPLQRLKNKYNNPRTLSTKVNLQDLSVELRMRPPYVLCDEEVSPSYGQNKIDHSPKLTIASAYDRYIPFRFWGITSLVLNCICALLNLSRGAHTLNETHGHIDATFDSEHYQTSATFFVCCFLSIYQIYLMCFPHKRRRPLAWATLGSMCLCHLYLWEHRSSVGLLFHVSVGCMGTFVITTRQMESKLPQYTL